MAREAEGNNMKNYKMCRGGCGDVVVENIAARNNIEELQDVSLHALDLLSRVGLGTKQHRRTTRHHSRSSYHGYHG